VGVVMYAPIGGLFDSRIAVVINRPGPMQAEPVNLVRRGTEQP